MHVTPHSKKLSSCNFQTCLFQFGVSVIRREQQETEVQDEIEISESYLPPREDTNLRTVEYRKAASAVVDLSRPEELSQPTRRKRGKYCEYSGEDRLKIGKYANENSNKSALTRFAKEFPGLKESSVRNFKKAYQENLSLQKREGNLRPITSLSVQKRGRPPLLFDLDSKY